jgi:hypothetical protein
LYVVQTHEGEVDVARLLEHSSEQTRRAAVQPILQEELYYVLGPYGAIIKLTRDIT